jgi:hypothetical protein
MFQKPLSAALSRALQLLAAVEPSALLQQVRLNLVLLATLLQSSLLKYGGNAFYFANIIFHYHGVFV